MSDAASPTPKRGWGRILLLVAIAGLVAVAGWWFFLRPDEVKTRGFGDYKFDDPARVYMGRAVIARRPAVVDSSRIYASIPEYQQIRSEGLRDNVPRYHFLMVEASKRFKKALKAAARVTGHDVVAEVGTVRAVASDAVVPPDITDEVIRHLP